MALQVPAVQASSSEPKTETTDTPTATTEVAGQAPAWQAKYDAARSSLPAAVQARLPTSATAAQHVSTISDKIDVLTAQGKDKLGQLSKTSAIKAGEWRNQAAAVRLSTDQSVLSKAWSVTNETNIALNLSLNQVGPLMYQTVLPNETFERRVPNLYFALEVRPWTGASSAYTPWSVTWPILCVTGPSVAAASLLAIPFVALAAGGTALASLTSFGSAAASSAASAGSAVTSAGASAAGLAARAAALPGGRKIKGRLVDAARRNVGDHGEVLTGKVVRYFTKPGQHAAEEAEFIEAVEATAAAQNPALLSANAAEGEAASTPGTGSIASHRSASRERKEAKRRSKKPVEVDVTGFELESVLKCETGKSKVDKALSSAFADLDFKETRYKTVNNPVLRVLGGPELEERDGKQLLVFYPLVVELVSEVEAEAVSIQEVPPTESEQLFLRDARVVPTLSEAEAATRKAPVHGEGEWTAERGAEGGEVDKAVESALKAEAAADEKRGDSPAGKDEQPAEQEEPSKDKSSKGGWFSGWTGGDK